MSTEIGGIFVKIGADIGGLTTGLDKASETLKNFGRKMEETGKNLSLYLTTPIITLGTAISKFGMDFEKSFAKVTTMFDTAKISSKELEKDILKLSDTSGIAATEISESFYEALSAGVPISEDTSRAIKFMSDSVNLAKGGFTSLASAVDVTTSIVNAYGLSLNEVAAVQNALIITQNLGKTTVDELSHSLSQVIPIAASLKVPFEQVGAALASITAQGVPTAQATTQLRAVFAELAKSGTSASDAFKSLSGQSFKEFIAAGGTVQEALKIMAEGAKNSGKEIGDLFSSIEATGGALILASETGGKLFIDTMGKMKSEATAVADNVEKVNDTVGKRWSSAFNEMKNSAIKFFDVLAPGIEILSKVISSVAEYLSSFDKETQSIIVVLAGLLAAIGPVTAAIGFMASGIAAIGIPAAAAIAAIGALVAALVGVYKVNEEFRNAVTEIIDLLGKLAVKMYVSGKAIVEGLIKGLEDMVSAITPVIVSIANTIIALLKSILGIASPSKEAEKIGESVGEGLVAGLDGSQSAVGQSASELASSLKEALRENLEKIDELGEAIKQALVNKYEVAYEAIADKSKAAIEQAEEEYDARIELLEDQTDEVLDQLDEQKQAVQDATDENIKQYKKEYDEKKKLIEDQTDAYVKGLEAQRDAVEDREDAASDKAKDVSYENKKKELQKTLTTPGQSYEDLEKAKNDLAELEANRAAEIARRTAREEKKSISDRIDAAKEEAKDKKDALKQEIDDKIEAEKEKEKITLRGIEANKEAIQDSIRENKKQYAEDLENFKNSEIAKVEAAQKTKEALTDKAQFEAQKMLVSGNQAEIVALLQQFYPGWQDAGLKFGEALVAGLNSQKSSASQAVSDILNLQNIIPAQQAQLDALSGSATQLSTSFTGITDGVNSFTETIQPISDAVTKISGIIGGVGDTFTGIGVGIGSAKDSAMDFFESMVNSIPGLEGINTWFQGLIDSVLPRFQIIIDSLTGTSLPILQRIFDYLKDTALPLVSEAINNFANTVLPPIIEYLQTWFTYLSDAMIKIVEYVTIILLPTILTGIEEWVPKIVTIITDFITLAGELIAAILPVATKVLDGLKIIFDLVFPYIAALVQLTFENLIPVISTALDIISGAIKTALAIIQGDWTTVFGALGGIAQGAIDIAGGLILTALTIIAQMFIAFFTDLTAFWDKAWKDLSDSLTAIWDGIYDAIENTIGSINAAIGELISYVQQAIDLVDQLNGKQVQSPGATGGASGGAGGGGSSGGGGGGGSSGGGGGGVLGFGVDVGAGAPDYFTLSGASAARGAVGSTSNSVDNSVNTGDLSINIDGAGVGAGAVTPEVSSAVSTIQNFALGIAARGGRT